MSEAKGVSSNGVQILGWGIKEGGSWKSWKKRMFRLNTQKLEYFKDENMTHKMGDIDVPKVTHVLPVEIYKKRRNIIRLITPSRTYHVSVADEKTRDEWVAAIKNTVGADKAVAAASPKKELITMDDFEIISLLGKGAFGKVMLVKMKKDGNIYAMKTVEKVQVIDSNEVEHILSEKLVLSKINNPFLVNMHYTFQTPTHLVFVLDYCAGGELFSYLQKQTSGIPEDDVRFYAAQILLALEHMHSTGIIYRDIKPENILFEKDGYLRMTDFGLAKSSTKTTNTFCGTPEYLAPEVVEGLDYDENVDWWGLGILIYEMLFTKSPFLADSMEELYENILEKEPIFPTTKPISAECMDFIKQLLTKDPVQRLTDPDQMKTHSWFKSFSFDDLYQKKLTPPFVPQIKSVTDTSNFDVDITSEHVDLTSGVEAVNDNKFFSDFTYVPK
ncbi:hypothetical protein EIN_095820 [Entamoeba invadens IP1]|uniref:non-specific serine/threonine protein kinase n=1 Tax=Entamoeba invadens IP1 TaxID=370355 RepID=A0A0A1U0A9_ENTIV|nr:hypothetical protein EIN_095820 [Entamoeba invadens IP1]ELP87325.1 hypothetical protein EIN_095820 [Entamoeba invadens IP1]|eukprot:XP_004254096.1 hypothetical protein EIN_095820 [Entamoeba invadens IP1]